MIQRLVDAWGRLWLALAEAVAAWAYGEVLRLKAGQPIAPGDARTLARGHLAIHPQHEPDSIPTPAPDPTSIQRRRRIRS